MLDVVVLEKLEASMEAGSSAPPPAGIDGHLSACLSEVSEV